MATGAACVGVTTTGAVAGVAGAAVVVGAAFVVVTCFFTVAVVVVAENTCLVALAASPAKSPHAAIAAPAMAAV